MVMQNTIPRRGRIILLSALAGFALTVVWSAAFVDRVIGENVAHALLGGQSSAVPGVVHALVSGIAGTFTACNVAAFGAVAPLAEGQARRGGRGRLAAALSPLGWLAAGMVPVAAAYGAVAAMAGTAMPQFSTAQTAAGLSPRNIQSMVVFGVVGLALCYLGLAALRVVPDPLARISERFPHARLVVLGALIGAFLAGRPFGLFRELFRDVAVSRDLWYGALAFTLQSLGNIAVMALVLVPLAYAGSDRLRRWLAAKPHRAAVVTGSTLIVAGVFTFLYWDVRLLARRDLLWYPTAPWA